MLDSCVGGGAEIRRLFGACQCRKVCAHGIKYATESLRTSGFCILVGPVCASNVSLSFIRKFLSTLESAHIVNVLISQLRRIYRQLRGI